MRRIDVQEFAIEHNGEKVGRLETYKGPRNDWLFQSGVVPPSRAVRKRLAREARALEEAYAATAALMGATVVEWCEIEEVPREDGWTVKWRSGTCKGWRVTVPSAGDALRHVAEHIEKLSAQGLSSMVRVDWDPRTEIGRQAVAALTWKPQNGGG